MLSSSMMKDEGVDLPQDIIRDILKRLPVKSLIRFQCVCRHWRHLFKESSFIADHLQHSSRQNSYIIFQKNHLHDDYSELYSLDSDMQVGRFQNSHLLNTLNHHGRIVDSSNGLICVKICWLRCSNFYFSHSCSPYSLLVWNPAIKEVSLVPEINIYESSFIGFGFCPSMDDYKIVIGYRQSDYLETFKVYSLRSRSWKEVKHRLDARLTRYPVTVNGVLYSPGEKKFSLGHGEGYGNNYLIFAFDLAMEVWIELPMPEQHCSSVSYRLMVYEGKLAYACCPSHLLGSVIHLWVLEEGVGASGGTWNWTKKFTSNPYPSFYLTPVTMWGDEIFCIIGDSGSANTVLINTTTNKFRNLNLSECGNQHRILNYVGSLVSIEGTHLVKWGQDHFTKHILSPVVLSQGMDLDLFSLAEDFDYYMDLDLSSVDEDCDDYVDLDLSSVAFSEFEGFDY